MNKPNFLSASFLNRKEFVAFVVAAILYGLTKLAAPLGLVVPEGEIQALTTVGVSFFVGSVLEGSYKVNWGDGWKSLFSSKRLWAVLGSLAATVANTFLPDTLRLPEETFATVLQFVAVMITMKSGVDALATAK